MNIAVIFGGISPERNVSITGGKAVVNALRSKGHNVIPVDPAHGADAANYAEELIKYDKLPPIEEYKNFHTKKIIECINSNIFDDIDIAFLVLHGQNGEDGKIQSLLNLRGIPYTGSGIKASVLSIDKLSSKMIFTAAGILTPPWMPVRKKDFGNYKYYEDIRSELGNHLVVKPNDQGSTIGISIVDGGNLDDINDAVQEAAKYSEEVLAEKFISGREITVGIVGEDILPVIEIVPHEGFYDYEHKYTEGRTEYVCPAEITEDIEGFTQDMAYLAFQVLGCSGFARADFRLDDEGQPFLLEMNTIPGFTEMSLVPKAAKQIGIEFPELCEKIIDIALNKNNKNESVE
jgi:D-alanine-D-alanine ligase